MGSSQGGSHRERVFVKNVTNWKQRRAERQRRILENRTANVVALPATTTVTQVPLGNGFSKLDDTARTSKVGGTKVTTTTVKAGTTTTFKSWEPDYLKQYDAIYPMDKNLLFRVLSVQSVSRRTQQMEKFIIRFLDDQIERGQPMVYVRDTHGNIYVVKGMAEVYPTIVAHTDTVHSIVPGANYQVRSDGKRLWAIDPENEKYTGVGGDDKVGIFIALSMLRDLPVCKAAFFVDEEIGCVGSSAAKMEFFTNSSLVLQCDRRGNDEFVDRIMGTELYGKEFADAVRPILRAYDYVETTGGMTDVWQLKENGLGVACANMACGYFSPHSRYETVGWLDVQRTYDLVQHICEALGDRRWAHTAPTPEERWESFTRGGSISYGGWDSDEWYGGYSDTYYKWEGGELVKKQGEPREDTPKTSLAYWQEKHPEWFDRDDQTAASVSDWKAENRGDALEAIIKGQVSISQLLDEDRAIIEASGAMGVDIPVDMDYRGNQTFAVKMPKCPECGFSDAVIFDDSAMEFYCWSCDASFDPDAVFGIDDALDLDPMLDDETRMP